MTVNPDGSIEDKQPENLDEVVDMMIELIKEQNVENQVAKKGIAHHGPGTSIRNNLNLWWQEDWPKLYNIPKPPLVEWFNKRKIFHADDMSGTITEAVQAKLNEKKFDVDEHLKKYFKHWKELGYKDGIFTN